MNSAIRLLIVLTIAGFLVQLGMDTQGVDSNTEIISQFALWPLHAGFMPWQLITYAFLHAGFTHLAFNMLGLWMFGRELEYVLGRVAVLQLYFASVLSAALLQLLVSSVAGDQYPTVGASGGVFGLLLAYAMIFPNRTVMLLLPPIPLPARVFVTFYALIELVLGVTGTQAGVAHFAHLGGMVGGYLMMYHWRSGRSRRG